MGRLAAHFALSQSAAEDAVWPLALQYGTAYGIDPALIMAVTWQESRFSPTAIRQEPQIGDASRGLMQVLWSTAQSVASALGLSLTDPSQLFDPDTNVAIGARYLADQIARYGGKIEAALAAYNAGAARTSASGAYVNQRYVDAVMGKLPTYQQQEALPLVYQSSAPADTATGPTTWGAVAYVAPPATTVGVGIITAVIIMGALWWAWRSL